MRNFENVIGEVSKAIGPPGGFVFVQGFPFDHTLPGFVGTEKVEFFMEGHLFQIRNGSVGGRVPLNAQSFASFLHFIVFSAPTPKGIGITIDPFHITGTETDNATKVLGVIGISVPYPSNVQRRGGELGVGGCQVRTGQQVDIVKYEDIVRRRIVGGSTNFGFASYIKSNVEQLASIELATIIGLFHNINVIITDATLGQLLVQEAMHMRQELGQMFGSVLSRMQISIWHNDGRTRQIRKVHIACNIAGTRPFVITATAVVAMRMTNRRNRR